MNGLMRPLRQHIRKPFKFSLTKTGICLCLNSLHRAGWRSKSLSKFKCCLGAYRFWTKLLDGQVLVFMSFVFCLKNLPLLYFAAYFSFCLTLR